MSGPPYHPGVTPFHLFLAGGAALLAGFAILRTFGPSYRVGRLLGSTSRVSVAEALAIAASGAPRYVRVDGRIDADEPFEDADHRPLVLRRTTFEVRRGGRWDAFDTHVEGAAFEVSEGLDTIGVDGSAIDVGLVVVPRETAGVVGDLLDHAPDDLARDLPVRVVVRHVSSVEHASVLGVPTRDESGRIRMRPGLGRPLVLTTLEVPEAMRVLAGGEALRPRLAAAAFALGTGLLVLGLGWGAAQALTGALGPAVAYAASPAATSAVGSDTRSSGQGPGLVGDPATAVLVVVAIALAASLVTQGWVRLTGRRRDA